MAQVLTRPARRRGTQVKLTGAEWRRLAGMGAVVATLNVVGWLLVAAASGHRFQLGSREWFGFGTGALAYTLGMRHAFDADHIAAIDNTTRKLVGEGRRPLSVGLWFSLGHSSVVLLLALALNLGIRSLDHQVTQGGSALQHTAAVVGTAVSAGFLFLIAAVNLVALRGVTRAFFRLRGSAFDEAELERYLQGRGLLLRIVGPVVRRVDRPAAMFPVGFLFGLGFDTATEVALLVVAGSAVVGGLPLYAVLALPVLFAAGMSLFDGLDGCFMNFAYDWAFSQPVRKVYYNVTVTALSVLVAAFVGGVEALGLLGRDGHLGGPFWRWAAGLDLNRVGYVIVGVFVATWAVALAVWRLGRIERRWQADPADLADD